jgi:hypothetical protein
MGLCSEGPFWTFSARCWIASWGYCDDREHIRKIMRSTCRRIRSVLLYMHVYPDSLGHSALTAPYAIRFL